MYSLLNSAMDASFIPYIVIGVLALVALIALIVGIVKGFTGLNLRPLSWAIGCAAFVTLEIFFHENNFILALIPMELEPWLYSLLSTLIWLFAALLVRGIVSGIIVLMKGSRKKNQLDKAEKISHKEKVTGEEHEVDENELYSNLPVDGKKKPSALNRLFGGIFAIINVAVVLIFVAAIALVVLNVTPLRAEMLKPFFEEGFMAAVFPYVLTYTLDFILIATVVGIISKGYACGLMSGVRSIGIFLAYIAALVGSFYLPFSPFVAEGMPLAFVGNAAGLIAGLIPEAVPANISLIIGQVAVGIVLCIILCLLVKFLGWVLDKLLDVIDNVGVLRVIDGSLGAIVYSVLAVAVVAIVVVLLYALEYYGIFQSSSLFSTNSPLMGGLFDACDAYLRPALEQLTALLG